MNAWKFVRRGGRCGTIAASSIREEKGDIDALLRCLKNELVQTVPNSFRGAGISSRCTGFGICSDPGLRFSGASRARRSRIGARTHSATTHQSRETSSGAVFEGCFNSGHTFRVSFMERQRL
jgi:hypothetical protein